MAAAVPRGGGLSQSGGHIPAGDMYGGGLSSGLSGGGEERKGERGRRGGVGGAGGRGGKGCRARPSSRGGPPAVVRARAHGAGTATDAGCSCPRCASCGGSEAHGVDAVGQPHRPWAAGRGWPRWAPGAHTARGRVCRDPQRPCFFLLVCRDGSSPTTFPPPAAGPLLCSYEYVPLMGALHRIAGATGWQRHRWRRGLHHPG